MANTDNPHGFLYEYTMGGKVAAMMEDELDTSVTVARGDVIYRNSSGYLDIATAATPSIMGVVQEGVTGAAAVRPKVLYIPATVDNVFSAQADGNFTQALLGTSRSLVGSTGIMEIDTDDTAPGQLRVIGLRPGPGNVLGGNAQLLCVFHKSQFTGIVS